VEPTSGSESWRTWLLTGARGSSVDRRRVRGEHRGLKRMLVEGTTNGDERHRPWQEFSGAMVRHAVDEAMNGLPREHKEIVKLAYFSGLSNREIAAQLGLSVGGVQRRLRQAFAYLSDQVGRGQAMARRAAYGIAFWLSGRWIGESARRSSGAVGDHLIRAGALIAAGAGAAAVLAFQPPAPAGTHVPPHAVNASRATLQAAPVRVRPVEPAIPAPPANLPAAGLVPQLTSTTVSALPSLPRLPLRLLDVPSVPNLIVRR
jgi:RNA polymerase sigma factor (sigma-70 family)